MNSETVCLYDSAVDTLAHIKAVQGLMNQIILELQTRLRQHDSSKLESPEKGMFDEYTPKLRALTYGSDEYKQCLREMGKALEHHYQINRHHPEHFENGVNDMTLIDLLEMLVDWKAATKRHADGDIIKSLAINKKRFGLSEQLMKILENTVHSEGWQ